MAALRQQQLFGSSNEKSLLLIGLFGNKLAQRMLGLGQTGGGRGTGVEHSPPNQFARKGQNSIAGSRVRRRWQRVRLLRRLAGCGRPEPRIS
jgi:hypothetical protein